MCTVSEVIRCKEGLLYSVYRSYFFLSLYISLSDPLNLFLINTCRSNFQKKRSQSWRLSIPPCIRPCSPVCGFVCLVPVQEAQYTPCIRPYSPVCGFICLVPVLEAQLNLHFLYQRRGEILSKRKIRVKGRVVLKNNFDPNIAPS